jgi:hypothetical protein
MEKLILELEAPTKREGNILFRVLNIDISSKQGPIS